jgi:NOL1/NOP2/fmu family ribosome biogenesis protein
MMVRGKQHRAIVAAPSEAAAARALEINRGSFEQWYCQTGNDVEIAVATAQPGVVFLLDGDLSARPTPEKFHPVQR